MGGQASVPRGLEVHEVHLTAAAQFAAQPPPAGAPPPLTIVHTPKLPTHELTNLSGNASRNWSRHISRNASKPVAPAKVEYGAVNEPFDGFGKLNNASAAFMTWVPLGAPSGRRATW